MDPAEPAEGPQWPEEPSGAESNSTLGEREGTQLPRLSLSDLGLGGRAVSVAGGREGTRSFWNLGSDSTLLFSLHPTPGVGGRKPYPPGQSPGARGTSLALQESSIKCTELQEENWQFWKEVTLGDVRDTWVSGGQVTRGVTGVGFALKPSSLCDLTVGWVRGSAGRRVGDATPEGKGQQPALGDPQ